MSSDGQSADDTEAPGYGSLKEFMQGLDGTTVFWPPDGGPGGGTQLHGAYISHLIHSIFSAGPVRDFLLANFAGPDAEADGLGALLGQFRGFFAQNLTATMRDASMGEMDRDIIEQARRLAEFERAYSIDSTRYQTSGKPNPDAVYWSNPVHPSHPASLFDTLPMVEPLKLLDKTTPVGSAGSCFASEIAYHLQNHGYNYVITESDEIDGPQPESCARWGIIFNTPSFRQLAEKAFGERVLPKLVEFHPAGNYWQDPYRENIPYVSIEDLEADRDAHLKACRQAFETCKVFFITLGLNECWEFRPDGSVTSRNPKSPAHTALFRHRVLTVAENVAHLQAFLDILRHHNPDLTLIVTVSPVPFMATGRADTHHVVTANAHSKAVLRVAAEEFVAANDDVYYFPSYEMVMHCLEDAWEDDQRHVKRAAVARIMQLFEKMFVDDGAAA